MKSCVLGIFVALICIAGAVRASSSEHEGAMPAAEAASVGECNYGEPHPNAPPELAQFAFLIGDFEITSHGWAGDDWTPPRPGPRARWNGWYGLGGMAIYDEWYDPGPSSDPDAPRGVNVRMFDPEAEQWQMGWIGSAALQVQDLRAEMRDGKLTMWQVYPERPDFLADFTVVDEDHWYRTSYNQDANGEWTRQFKLAASRMPCG